jgi:hypothetical protein
VDDFFVCVVAGCSQGVNLFDSIMQEIKFEFIIAFLSGHSFVMSGLCGSLMIMNRRKEKFNFRVDVIFKQPKI